jgi:NTP pyrophosphatase (non-canonical NTP hydrolase)
MSSDRERVVWIIHEVASIGDDEAAKSLDDMSGMWYNILGEAADKILALLAPQQEVNPEPTTGRCLGVEVRAPQQGIRPSVLHFAHHREERLRKHDAERGERGWMSEDVEWLYDRLMEEVAELRKALDLDMHFPPVLKWTEEAADVANFAMMIADVSGGLLGVEQKIARAPQQEPLGYVNDSTLLRLQAGRTGEIHPRQDGTKTPLYATPQEPTRPIAFVDGPEEGAALREHFKEQLQRKDRLERIAWESGYDTALTEPYRAPQEPEMSPEGDTT